MCGSFDSKYSSPKSGFMTDGDNIYPGPASRKSLPSHCMTFEWLQVEVCSAVSSSWVKDKQRPLCQTFNHKNVIRINDSRQRTAYSLGSVSRKIQNETRYHETWRPTTFDLSVTGQQSQGKVKQPPRGHRTTSVQTNATQSNIRYKAYHVTIYTTS